MRRFVRTAALAAAALIAVGVSAGTSTAATAPAVGTASCTGTVAITQLAWTPATVLPGQTPVLNGTAANCTAQPVTVDVLVTFKILGPSTSGGVPQGCIVEDPIYQQVTIAANGTYAIGGSYMVLSACTATGVQASVTVSTQTNSTVLAQGSAQVAIQQPQPPVACHVAYTVQSEWQGGFSAGIAITNTGEQTFNGWKLTFTFGGDQKINNVWGATASQSGAAVTLTNLSYDATIAPGATMSSVGLGGTWTVSDAAPSGFAVDGVACS